MSRMAQGATMLARNRKAYAGVTVSYCRLRASRPTDSTITLPTGVTISAPDTNGNVIVSLSVIASRGKIPYQQIDDSGTILSMELGDYLIDVADFDSFWGVVDSGEQNPMRGDWILDTLADGPGKFVVMPPGSEPVCRLSSVDSPTWRIHTKRNAV